MKLAVMLALVAATAAAQPAPPPAAPTLTISGTGTAKAAPDRVSFTVGVANVRPTVAEAYRETTAASNRVIAALRAHGVRDAEIQTSNFSVYTPTEPDDKPARQRPPRYGVRSDVTVTREDPKALSELLQAAIDAGANVVGDVSFFLADPSALRDRAIARAFEDARARAEKLAELAGRKLGPVQTMSVGSYTPYAGYNRNNVAEAITVTAEAPAIETGMAPVSETVTVTFELR